MSADIAHDLQATAERTRSPRVRLILSIGPLTALAGLLWALLQPWRLTLLHPHGQGFWWLFAEPPLYVVLVGIGFRLLIARGLVEDFEDHRGQAPDVGGAR